MINLIKSLFRKKTLHELVEEMTIIEDKKFIITIREQTDIQLFFDLLKLFREETLLKANLAQNANKNIYCFATNFENSIIILETALANFGDTENFNYSVRRIQKKDTNTYFFMSDSSSNFNLTDQSLQYYISTMEKLLTKFNESQLESETDEAYCCDLFFPKLEILYKHFYYLLCVLNNIKVQNTNVTLYKDIDDL